MAEINEPLYLKIYNYLIDEIKAGKYETGERLPSEKELADKFNVSRITSKKSLEMLSQNGIINRMPGKGSFVIEDKDNIERYTPTSISSTNYNIVNKTLIGVVISDFSESYGIGLISGIEDQSLKNDFFIVTRRSHGDRIMEEKAIDDLIDLGVDGIIIMPVHGEYYSQRILRLILDEFPIVVVDRQLKGIPSTFIGSDNINAAYKAIEFLFSLGHKNISFLSPPPMNTSAIEDRIEGIVKCYAENEIAIDRSLWINELMSTIPGHTNRESILGDIEKIKDLLISKNNITCIFAAEYNIALLASEAVKSIEKKIPQDISIMCFDSPGSFTGKYEFTHIRQKDEEMGHKAVELLKNLIKGEKEFQNKQIFMETSLIHGNSTAKII